MIRKLAAAALIAVSANYFAKDAGAGMHQCGEFRLEGKFAQAAAAPVPAGTIVFLANEDAFSRIEFRLDASRAKGEKFHSGSRAEVVIRVETRCDFLCSGMLVEVKRLLDPWRGAKAFTGSAKADPALACRN